MAEIHRHSFDPIAENDAATQRADLASATGNAAEITEHYEKPPQKTILEKIFGGWGDMLKFPSCRPQ